MLCRWRCGAGLSEWQAALLKSSRSIQRNRQILAAIIYPGWNAGADTCAAVGDQLEYRLHA